MRLVVTIPAFNEEETIGEVVRSIPRDLDGIADVKVLLVDDGCRDNTVPVALAAGCDAVLSFRRSRGLAKAFKAGLDEALCLGADIIVNIDADNQYVAAELESLLRPILDGKADIVLGSRFRGSIESMPWSKRVGNRFGSRVTGLLARMPVSDAQTGFRAFTREAAMALNVLSPYTYTQETIIQAAFKRLSIVEVPVTFRKRDAGDSRLVSSFLRYASISAVTVLRTFLSQHALGVLSYSGGFLMLMGLALGGRVLAHYFTTGLVSLFVPSAIAAGFLVVFGFQIILLGLIADMVGRNRELIEDVLLRVKGHRG